MSNGSPLPESVRWHPEPCRYLTDREVHAVFAHRPEAFLAFLQTALDDIVIGATTVEQPKKQIFDDRGGGDFRVMPCVVKGPAGPFKTVKVVGTNVAGFDVPDQVTVGKAMVLHPVENYVTDVVDACLLSSARTAACAAVGAMRLGWRPGSARVVGSGRVGFYLGLYLHAAFPGIRLAFADALSQRADRLASELRSLGIEARSNSASEDPAELVILATTSTVPLLSRAEAGEAAVISVGADTPWQRELADDWADEAAVLVDTADSLHVGDLLAWHEAGLNLPERMPMTQAVPSELRLFISTGSALFDNVALRYLVSEIPAEASDSDGNRGKLLKP